MQSTHHRAHREFYALLLYLGVIFSGLCKLFQFILEDFSSMGIVIRLFLLFTTNHKYQKPPLGHVNKLTVLYCSVLNGMFTLLLLTLYIIEGGTNLESTDYITSNTLTVGLLPLALFFLLCTSQWKAPHPHTPGMRETSRDFNSFRLSLLPQCPGFLKVLDTSISA